MTSGWLTLARKKNTETRKAKISSICPRSLSSDLSCRCSAAQIPKNRFSDANGNPERNCIYSGAVYG